MLKYGTRHIKIVSERLGHANVKITIETYAHVLTGMQEGATEKFSKHCLDREKRTKIHFSILKLPLVPMLIFLIKKSGFPSSENRFTSLLPWSSQSDLN